MITHAQELINKLQKIVNEHGNLMVLVNEFPVSYVGYGKYADEEFIDIYDSEHYDGI